MTAKTKALPSMASSFENRVALALEHIAAALEEQNHFLRKQIDMNEEATEITRRQEGARDEMLRISRENLDLQKKAFNQSPPPEPPEPWQAGYDGDGEPV